jgi:hypothetical protein
VAARAPLWGRTHSRVATGARKLPVPGPGAASPTPAAAPLQPPFPAQDDFEILLDEDGPAPGVGGATLAQQPSAGQPLRSQGSLGAGAPPPTRAAAPGALEPPSAPRAPIAHMGAASSLAAQAAAAAVPGLGPGAGALPGLGAPAGAALPRPPPGPLPAAAYASYGAGYGGSAFTHAAAPLSATHHQELAFVPMGMAGMQVRALAGVPGARGVARALAGPV